MKPEDQVTEVEGIKNNNESDENLGNEENKKPRTFTLKSRLLWLLFTLLIAIILLLISVPGFFDNSTLKFKIEQKASEVLNSNLTISGKVNVAMFPYITVIANDVLLKNYRNDGKVYNLYAKSLKIRLSFAEFLQKNFVISKIFLDEATLESYYEIDTTQNRQNKFREIESQFQNKTPIDPDQKPVPHTSSELFAIDKFKREQFSSHNLPTLEVRNSAVISYDKSARKREIEGIDGKIVVDAKKIRASGKFINEKVSTDFKFTANFNSEASDNDSMLELKSTAMNLMIKGSFTGENRGVSTSDFSGKVDAEIFDIRTFYKNYISNNSAIYEKLKPNSQSVKISSNIKNSGGEILLDNIVVNSNLVNGEGTASIDLTSDVPRVDVSLNLENLDLDNIWSNERIDVGATNQGDQINNDNDEVVEGVVSQTSSDTNSNQAAEAKNSANLDLKMVDKIRDFDLSAEVQIKDVKYLDGAIKDTNLYFTIATDGKILILPLIFKIPGEGVVRLDGAIDNSSGLPKFIGKIDVSGKNLGDTVKWLNLQSQNLKFDTLKEYAIYSNVALLPNNIALNDFYLNLNNGQSEILGEIKIDSSDKVTQITNKIRVNTFKLDDFFLTSGQNIYLSPGSLLKKFLWLNDIQSASNVDISFDKLIYKGEEFSNGASVKISFGQGYLKITELKLDSNQTNLQANLTVDISNKSPEFNLNVVADNIHYEATQSKNSEDPNRNSKIAAINIADQFFALPSLEGFDGKITLAINKLQLDDLKISNAKLNGKLKDGNISESEVSCDIYSGNLKYEGLIGIKNNKIINGNLTTTNTMLEKLLPDLVGITNIRGAANISASITSVANSKEDFVKSVNSEIKFNLAAPAVKGYGLNNLVNKMFYPANFKQELQNPEKILINESSETLFNQATGTITLNKDKGGKFSINLMAPAANGILSGKIDLSSNSIDGLTNIIFITGSRQKQVPINVATALKGSINNATTSSNLDQARQYLGLPTLTTPSKSNAAAASSTAAVTSTSNATTDTSATTPAVTPNTTSQTTDGKIANQQTLNVKMQEDASKQQAFDQLKAVMANPNSYYQNQGADAAQAGAKQ